MKTKLSRSPRRAVLYGPDNKPLSAGLYPSTRGRTGLHRPRANLNADTRENVSAYDRKEMVNLGRQIFARMSNLGAAIVDKNFFAFGDAWEPTYTGGNAAWGEEATRFLREQFFPNCDRHGRYDWRTCLFLSGIAWDRDGDDLMVLTEDSARFPKVEFIPGTRIGSRPEDAVRRRAQGGRWNGFEIIDGVIFDEGGTPVAVRVLGKDREGRTTFQDFSIGYGGNADLAYLPEWQDQGRGIPLLGRCELDWMDLEDIDEFLKRGVKRASSVGLLHKNATGEAPTGNEILTEGEVTDTLGTSRTVTYEEVEGGEVYYLCGPEGEDIAGLNYQNPHPNVENFVARIERRGLRAVGWNYELIYLAESGRAATRLVCRLGNNSIWRQQSLGLRRTWRAARYALAKGMKGGFLSRNADPRDAYFAWEFGLPEPLSVDQGNDEQADRENLKMGTTNKAIIAAKKGYHWREIGRQRKAEILQNARDAADIEDETAGKIPFEKALEMIEQRSANPVAQQTTAAPPDGEDGKA